MIPDRKLKIQKWATVVLIAAAGLVISPVVFLAIKGIVGLALAALLGTAVVTFAPWAAMKFANWRVKAIAAEAKENPIETMVNLLLNKRQAYAEFKANVETAVTAKKDFEAKCREFSQRYPARAEEFNQQLAAMNELVERKKAALVDARNSLEQGEIKLTEMRAYWEMSQAAQAAHAAAGMDTGDLYERLKADTAVDAVFESVNRAFAQLEVAAALNQPQLTNNASTVANYTSINTGVAV